MNTIPYTTLKSFIIVFNKSGNNSDFEIASDKNKDAFVISSPGNAINMLGIARSEYRADGKSPLLFHTGDDSELKNDKEENNALNCTASSAKISVDLENSEVAVCSSIVGLPPVFYCDLIDKLIIASDIHLFGKVADFSFYFDIDGIFEASKIGYPIGQKTLFKDIKMLPAGHILTVQKDRQTVIQRQWKLPIRNSNNNWDAFLEQQIEFFKNAFSKIDLRASFLSLTAGMDTRAIFAELVANNRKIKACTMTGPTLSLDARIARKLCKSYSVDHDIVVLNSEFLEQLPSYCAEACRLTGGLGSLSQAHEIYFYRKVHSGLNARLSGNLGNQVGRGGAENISLRNASIDSFASDIIEAIFNDVEHWYKPFLRPGGRLAFEFLMEKEIPFSSVGNYGIGNNYAMQKSPYADKELITISRNRPMPPKVDKEISLIRMRLKDLRHRFLGEPIETSFQRKLIKQIGGAVSEIPINWGGKAKGGASVFGLGLGMGALIDAALASKGIDSGPISGAANLLRIKGMHDYRLQNLWLRQHLREFCLDLFSSGYIKNCGLFNQQQLMKNAQKYFNSQIEIHKDICLSLDLALAAKMFKAILS